MSCYCKDNIHKRYTRTNKQIYTSWDSTAPQLVTSLPARQ